MKRLKAKSVLALSTALVCGLVSLGGISTLSSCSLVTNGSLYIDSEPTKTTYSVGESLDLTGLVVYGKKADGAYLSNTDSVLIEDYQTSIANGTTLDNDGEFEVKVTRSGYASASFKIYVGDVTVKKLVIRQLPRKLSYKVGDKFNTNGLSLAIASYKNGVEQGSGVTLIDGQYSLSIKNGEKLNKEGNFLVEVYKDGYQSVYFTIAVLTVNNSFSNIMTTLENSRNYEIEIYNTVATTVNEYGFHYKEIVTNDYFNKITYKKSAADESEDERGLSEDTNVAYVNYDKGVYQVDLTNLDDNGYPTAGKVLSDQTKWYRADLVSVFDIFKSVDIPTTTKNGKFVIEVVLDKDEVEANSGADTESWTTSLANNPFAEKFLELCGWSDSLISILTTIEIETDGESTLTMKGNLGGYGYTSVSVSNIGLASVSELDSYMKYDARSFDTNIDDCVKVPALKEIFEAPLHNYTMTLKGSYGGESFTSYNILFGDNFIWFEPSNYYRKLYYSQYGYIPFSCGYFANNTANTALASLFPKDESDTSKAYTEDGTGIFSVCAVPTYDATNDKFTDTVEFTTDYIDLVTYTVSGKTVVADPKDFYNFEYSAIEPDGSASSSLSYGFIFEQIGSLLTEQKYASTWFIESRLSTEKAPFIISYDGDTMRLLGEAILGDEYDSYKSQFNSAIIAPTYELDETTGDVTKVSSIELWLLNMSTYRGYANQLDSLNDTSLPEFVSKLLSDNNITL